MTTTAERAPDRTGIELTEEAYYLLKRLHKQLRLISHLSASCFGQDDYEPMLPIHAWFGCLETMAEQASTIIDGVTWKGMQTSEAQ